MKISYNLVLNKHKKPNNAEELGYFLAGLIDADGSIKDYGHIQITAHIRDLWLGYYLKKTINYGYLYKFKKVKAYYYVCSDHRGLIKFSKLVVNKLRLAQKIKQFNERLAPRVNSELCKNYNLTNIQNNHWFAGFVQGDGSFQIMIRKPGKPSWSNQVEIVLAIELKHKDLLEQIQAAFGGHIGYRKSRDTYYYSSVNLKNANKLVNYFDKYQVMGPSYRLYLCWKQALSIVLAKKHLTFLGLKEIKFLKAYMTHLRNY